MVQGLYTHASRDLLKKAGLFDELETHTTADSLFRVNWELVGCP
jgi:hypothetical protein